MMRQADRPCGPSPSSSQRHPADGAGNHRARSRVLRRARLAWLAAMSLALIAATRVPPSPGALDPAASWRALLAAAGCPPAVAHELSVRIERLEGGPPATDPEGALSAAQRAEQITHLAVGRHGLQLTTTQFDAALSALFGRQGASHEQGGDRGDPSTNAGRAPPHQAAGDPTEPFTTRHAVELLREWLPTPAQR